MAPDWAVVTPSHRYKCPGDLGRTQVGRAICIANQCIVNSQGVSAHDNCDHNIDHRIISH